MQIPAQNVNISVPPAIPSSQPIQPVVRDITKMSREEIQAYLSSMTSSTPELPAQPVLPAEMAVPVQNPLPAANVAHITGGVSVPSVVPLLSSVPVSPSPAHTPAPSTARLRQRVPVSQQAERPQTGLGQGQTNASIPVRQSTAAAAPATGQRAPVRQTRPFAEPVPRTPDAVLTAALAEIEAAPGSSQPTVPVARTAPRPRTSTVSGYTRTNVPNEIVRIGTNTPISPVL